MEAKKRFRYTEGEGSDTLFQTIPGMDIAKRLDLILTNAAIHTMDDAELIAMAICPAKGIHYTYPAMSGNETFYVSGVGRWLVAVTAIRLFQRRSIALSERLTGYFEKSFLAPLCTYQGVDASGTLTLLHLLTHTSGIASYLEDRNLENKTMLDYLVEYPTRKYSTDDILEYVRKRLQPVDLPGKTFHYSETNDLLLGKVMELLEHKPLHQILHDELFSPLQMTRSFLPLFDGGSATADIHRVMLEGVEVTKYASLSADAVAGGIVTTAADLAIFVKALTTGSLVKPEVLAWMAKGHNRYKSGIYYGVGTMELRLEELLFHLRGFPRLYGHSGIFSAHLYFDPLSEAIYFLNLSSTKHMHKSFQVLIQMVSTLGKAPIVNGFKPYQRTECGDGRTSDCTCTMD
jgi:D-alanyl-D-alanine carboxypeptidase